MKAFYGSASYLWLILAVICTMEQHSQWGLLWISLFVGAYVVVGKGILFMANLVWDMEHDPAVRQQMMDTYLVYIMEQETLRKHLKYGR